MDNFFGIGTSSSFYDKRRHVNVILMMFLDYHFYATPGFADRLVALLQSSKSEERIAFEICNDPFLSFDELNLLKTIKEKVGLPQSDFDKIMSGVSLRYDKQYRTPAGYDRIENTRLLVDMVVAICYACDDFSSPAFTKMTAEVGGLAKGMKGISFDQTKFERLFNLTFEAQRIYQYTTELKQVEDYVIDRW